MIIKKAGQSIIQSKKSIFLAGPTPRNKIEVPSWRADALQLLEGYGFNGVVYVPEGKIEQGEYIDQAEWEWEALNSSDVTTFWVPRDLSKDSQGEMKMPAFTTNVEFG